MSEDHRERLKRFLLEAEGANEDARSALLERLRGEDPYLAGEAESLLSHRTREELAGRGLTEALNAVFPPGVPAPPQPLRRVGAYTLLELIGTGGMGAVYRAQQEEPIRREVAIKLLRGGLDPAKVLARFEEERRALALADHPGIARILDAGSDEAGTPYLVMELVRGMPITEFSRGKRLRETLELFTTVCRAVQHAHQKGVIHRDLKPSNILVSEVDGKPAAKVIDFGIARVVEEGTSGRVSLTGEGQIVGTLEYMSPEQASGRSREIDTRTDVYSLGVVLYELVTDSVPHDLSGKSLTEAIQIIRRDPPRPFRETGVERRPDSDLETITRKALETEPSRRYDGPGALADDVERYQRSEPIVARPPSTTYQLRKLVQRNRTAVLVGGVLVVGLLIFGVSMSILYAGQRRERERAEREAAKAAAVNEFLQGMLASADPVQTGRDLTVRQVVDRATASIDRGFSGLPEVMGALQFTLGTTYGGLGDFARSDSLLRHALEVRTRVHGRWSVEVAATLRELARNAVLRGRPLDADSIAVLALVTAKRVLGPEDIEVGKCLDVLGMVQVEHGDLANAERALTEAATIARKAHTPGDRWLGEVLGHLGHSQYALRRFHEAEASVLEAIRVVERDWGEDHPRLIHLYETLGDVYGGMGRYSEEGEARTRAHELASVSLGDDHALLASQANNLAEYYIRVARYDEAETLQMAALNSWLRVFGETNPHVVIACQNLGYLEHCRERLTRAEGWFLRAIESLEKQADQGVGSGYPYSNLAGLYVDLHRPAEAERMARRAVASDPNAPAFQSTLGLALMNRGAADSAEVWYRRAIEGQERSAPGNPELPLFRLGLGLTLDKMGRVSEADSLIRANRNAMVSGTLWPPEKRRALRLLMVYYKTRGNAVGVDYCRRTLAAIPK